MRSLLLVALLLALLFAPPALTRPNPTQLKNAFERHRAALVEVVGEKHGTGVVVGDGHVVTSVAFVGLHDAKVLAGGQELPAKVVFADAKLKIAVVKVAGEFEFSAAPVHPGPLELKRGAYLLGLLRGKDGAWKPAEGTLLSGPTRKSPFLEVGLALPPGSPVIDERGQLIAISVAQRGRYSSRALPISRVREALSAVPK